MTDPNQLPIECERRDDESSAQYRGLLAYLRMGQGSRSLQDLSEILQQEQRAYERYKQDPNAFASKSRPKKPPTARLATLKDWSASHSWVARAKAYDAYVDKLEAEALKTEAELLSKLKARKQIEYTLRELADCDAQLQKWDEAYSLARYHEQDLEQRRTRSDGSVEILKVIQTNALKMKQLSDWREGIARQMRLALDMPQRTTQTQLDHKLLDDTPQSWWEQVLARTSDEIADETDETGWT